MFSGHVFTYLFRLNFIWIRNETTIGETNWCFFINNVSVESMAFCVKPIHRWAWIEAHRWMGRRVWKWKTTFVVREDYSNGCKCASGRMNRNRFHATLQSKYAQIAKWIIVYRFDKENAIMQMRNTCWGWVAGNKILYLRFWIRSQNIGSFTYGYRIAKKRTG